jgi:hypothetical protein
LSLDLLIAFVPRRDIDEAETRQHDFADAESIFLFYPSHLLAMKNATAAWMAMAFFPSGNPATLCGQKSSDEQTLLDESGSGRNLTRPMPTQLPPRRLPQGLWLSQRTAWCAALNPT